MISQKIKLVYIIDSFKKDGGAQKSLYLLISRLDQQRYTPYVVCLGIDESYAQAYQQLGVKTRVYNTNILNGLYVLFDLFLLLRREKPDIVQTYLFHADIMGRPLAKLARVPIIISSIRGFNLWKKKWHYALDKLTAPLATKITGVSEEIINFSVKNEGVKPEQVVKIPNGIDLKTLELNLICNQHKKKELGIQEGYFIVGFVGRLVAEKTLDYLIRAAKIVLEEHPKTIFLIVGGGPLRPELQELASEMALAEQVRFIGFRQDIPQLLALFDVFVLPSINEGLSNALLEAMAMERAVAVTEVGGNKEVVNDNCGILVPPKDEKALAEAILRLIEDKELRQRLGKAAQRRVKEKFSLEKMVTAYQKLYDDLYAQKTGQL
jgi:glycosyltransferase involved in cell wall biosynthesis